LLAEAESNANAPIDAEAKKNIIDISNPAPTSFTPPNRRGTLLFTLLDQPPYSLWNLPSLAKRPPAVCPGTNLPQLRYKVIRSFEFNPEVYSGYTHRRTLGFKEGLSKGANEEILGRKGRARTWEFARWTGEEKVVSKKRAKGTKIVRGKK
jgi:25S rRNA (uracil2634-N3)-methyltransferase